jgi:hypothetical protein
MIKGLFFTAALLVPSLAYARKPRCQLIRVRIPEEVARESAMMSPGVPR